MEVRLKPQVKILIVACCIFLSESAYGLGSDKDVKLDDGTGDSPSMSFIDGSDAEAKLQKLQGQGAMMSTTEGPITLKPSNESVNKFQFETLSSNPTFSFYNGDSNAPGLRLNNATKKLEYRDENSASWAPIDSFVVQSSFDSLSTTVSNLSMTVALKASQASLDSLTTTVNGKASQSALDSLTTTVGTKADQTTVNTLSTTVSQLSANVENSCWGTSVKTSNFSISSSDDSTLFLVDGSVTATLPAASSVAAGFKVQIERAGDSIITISRSGSDTIDGMPSLGLFSKYATATLVSNGSGKWYRLDSSGSVSGITANGCPESYINVPANALYVANDFCVAKYEMKNVSGVASSRPNDVPWTNITPVGATVACAALGDGYHLITNNEWMTVARNIENVAANWSGGVVGTGALNIGHSDNAPANALPANTDDNQACEGTGQTCSSTVFNSQRRTHVLSNGEVIWDLAGNADDWVNWTVPNNDKANPGGSWIEINTTTPTTSMPQQSYYPQHTTYTSTQGIGLYYPGGSGSGGMAARGGNRAGHGGVFSLWIDGTATSSWSEYSFRCAWSSGG